MSKTFFIKQNDRRPNLVAVLKDSDGVVVDFSTAVSVKFLMRLSGQAAKVDAAASFSDAVNGEVTYAWADGDTDTAGVFEGEFEVLWATGITQTFPGANYSLIKVVDDVG